MLARSFAISVGCDFKRIQFTSDLLPSDVVGVSVYNQKIGDFQFKPGPIFSNIILADEINRAPPKTQSALLEAMSETQVTVDGITYGIKKPFFVMATQNPIEYEGTYPLPEAQMDRFLMRLNMGYPKNNEEVEIMNMQVEEHPIDTITPAIGAEEIEKLQKEVTHVHIDNSLKDYIVEIISKTREHGDVYLGASPRGSLALFKTSKAFAALNGREFVFPDDIKTLADPVLTHRLILKPEARIKGITPDKIIKEVVESVTVPTVEGI